MAEQTQKTNNTEAASDLRERVEAALDKVRPSLQRDGGNIELLDVVEGVAKVKLQGSCAGCPMSQLTLTWGVEQALKKEVPEIVRVETDQPLPSMGGRPFGQPRHPLDSGSHGCRQLKTHEPGSHDAAPHPC